MWLVAVLTVAMREITDKGNLRLKEVGGIPPREDSARIIQFGQTRVEPCQALLERPLSTGRRQLLPVRRVELFSNTSINN
jgi:hypothetical protein